jgi:hypothetical protein
MLSNRIKYFCVGLNKTGTTSLAAAFRGFGYRVGDESQGQKILYAYERRDFKPIIKFAKQAQVFQDAPFSFKYTFMFLEQAFPNAKFILSVRDSEEQWYESLVKFHSKRFGMNGQVPTMDDLKRAKRPYNRCVYDNFKMCFGTPDSDMYQKATLIEYYNSHNQMVRDYFRLVPEKLLEINLSQKVDYGRFGEFIGEDTNEKDFPWENRTKDL